MKRAPNSLREVNLFLPDNVNIGVNCADCQSKTDPLVFFVPASVTTHSSLLMESDRWITPDLSSAWTATRVI